MHSFIEEWKTKCQTESPLFLEVSYGKSLQLKK
jgi:hypothetical protein